MDTQNNLSTSKVKRKEKRTLQTLLIYSLFILISSTLLLFLLWPALEKGFRMIIEAVPTAEFLPYLLTLVMFLLGSALLFVNTLMRLKDYREHESSPQPQIALYGNYDSDRQYLQGKIDELNKRLATTEEKWSQLNHLVVSASKNVYQPHSDVISTNFLSGFGIDINEIKIENDMAFVLTPSDSSYHEDYFAISEACLMSGIKAVRADETYLNYGNDNMLGFIIRKILSASVIIANISNRNPNVYYELGIAHMAGKPTILVCHNNAKIPFDLQHRFVIFYSSPDELSNKLTHELVRVFVKKNVNNNYAPNNASI